ncbi:putative phage portal protein [Wolbachia endosymbiont of Culex quinquefasciatus JHB]|nr:putative phage portal protein [Wolbachia endosymbiont of Culex quinquefasciatus JHB]
MLLKSFKQLFSKPKIKSSAWDAAGSGRRFFHFQPELGSINNLLSQNLETLRSRSRDMVRKNPYAANIIDTIVSNSIDLSYGLADKERHRNRRLFGLHGVGNQNRKREC